MWFPKNLILEISKLKNKGNPPSKEKKDEEYIKWGYQLHSFWGSDHSFKSWHLQYTLVTEQ